MGFYKEFKEFAMRGNVMDLAIGVIIGAAFGKIVSSLVTDLITPPLGLLIGGIDFTSLSIIIKEAHDKVPAVTLNYGKFIQTIFDFLIIAFVIFTVIKGINTLKRKSEPEPVVNPEPSEEVKLLTEIRDLLKK
jgi:large conductance mechanosensitive channel